MSIKLSWEGHIDNLKKVLDVNPTIIYANSEECQKLCAPYGGFRLTSDGCYLWKKGEDTVVIKKQGRVGTLAHEFRHAWQFKNQIEQSFEFDFSIPPEVRTTFSDYAASRKESDANQFAIEYCKEYGLTKQQIIVSLNHGSNILVSKLFRR